MMKRSAVLARLRRAAKAKGLEFTIIELSRHSAVRIGSTTRTLGRHSEVDDLTASKFFDQFANELEERGGGDESSVRRESGTWKPRLGA